MNKMRCSLPLFCTSTADFSGLDKHGGLSGTYFKDSKFSLSNELFISYKKNVLESSVKSYSPHRVFFGFRLV